MIENTDHDLSTRLLAFLNHWIVLSMGAVVVYLCFLPVAVAAPTGIMSALALVIYSDSNHIAHIRNAWEKRKTKEAP